MNFDVAASYDHCRGIARRSGSNFYYSFLLLPRAKRRAMFALYAFLRRTDDIGDDGQQPDRVQSLKAWRESLVSALDGRFDDPLLPALADTVRTHHVPVQHLQAVIDGVEMDLDERRYETFAELELYCERVASAVGLACLHVWGFTSEAALEPARQCGLAFQLTNILRDLKEDAARGRVYLPMEDLRRFDYTEDDLRAGVHDGRFRALMRYEIARAEERFAAAEGLDQWLAADCRGVFRVMFTTYRGLLEAIRQADGDVFSQRIRLSGWRKFSIAARQLWPRAAAAAR